MKGKPQSLLVFPNVFGDVPIFLLEDLSAEQIDRIDKPQRKEYGTGYDGVGQRLARKAKQEQERRDHDHSGKVGKNVQAGGWRLQGRVDLFHQDHAVGGSAGQGAEAHQEKFMLKALEALLGDLADIHEGNDSTDDAENDDRQNIILNIVDLNGCYARNGVCCAYYIFAFICF